MILNEQERKEERRLIMDGAWPHFPVLPVKRDNSEDRFGVDIGVILWRMGIEKGPIKVYLANLMAMSMQAAHNREKENRLTTYKELFDDPTICEGVLEYATLEDFFDAGWRGD